MVNNVCAWSLEEEAALTCLAPGLAGSTGQHGFGSPSTTVQCYLWHRVRGLCLLAKCTGISGCMAMDILFAVNTVIQCKHSKVIRKDMPVKMLMM